MINSRQTGRALIILILLSLIVRGFLAAFLEFGNDEVYYWTYALYPDLSHFDHPPMVGFLIQLSTLDLLFDSEFFIRLGPVILGAINTWLVYLIGKALRDEFTGLYAALLYTGSIYAFIIAGTFILPDTPQMTFWLLSLMLLLKVFFSPPGEKHTKLILLAGLTIGLGLLSKYTSAFLLLGVFLYMLIYDRKWFRAWQVYAGAAIAIAFFIPVLMWNFNNDFISFTFQGERVGIFDSGLRPELFFTELGGQLLYNNPVNVILGIIAMISLFRGKKFMDKNHAAFLLLIALPLIVLFLFFSLFRQTLPHWTGPAWTTIILVSAAFLREQFTGKTRLRIMPRVTSMSLALLVLVIGLGIMQIKGGMLFYDYNEEPENLGQRDVSLDMYGWRQLSDEFKLILMEEKTGPGIDPQSPFISSRWFPAANIDYYLARPNGLEVLGLGSLDALHKYAWITKARGGFRIGMDAWFLTLSRDFRDPQNMYGKYFESIEQAHVIPVHRNGRHVMNAYFYYLRNLEKLPDDILASER